MEIEGKQHEDNKGAPDTDHCFLDKYTMKAAATADAELTNSTTSLEVTRNALKGQPKAVQTPAQPALALLEDRKREKAILQRNAHVAVTAAQQQTERATDALRTHKNEWMGLNTLGYEIEKQEKQVRDRCVTAHRPAR